MVNHVNAGKVIKVLLIKKLALISSSLVVLSTSSMSRCDDKFEKVDSKEISIAMYPSLGIDTKQLEQGKEVSGALVLAANTSVRNYKKSNEINSALDSPKNSAIKEVAQKHSIILDLSLNLDLKEHMYDLKSDKQKQLQGTFDFKEPVFNIEMEAHFEGPHNENKERDMAPDGVGVGIILGI